MSKYASHSKLSLKDSIQFKDYLHNLTRKEQLHCLISPIHYIFHNISQKYTFIFSFTATTPSMLPKEFISIHDDFIHVVKKPKTTNIIIHIPSEISAEIPNSSDILDTVNSTEATIALEPIKAQITLNILKRKLNEQQFIIEQLENKIQEQGLLLIDHGEENSNVDANPIIIKQFCTYFSGSNSLWQSYKEDDFTSFSFSEVLKDMQVNAPGLYSFLRQLILSRGSYRNTYKTNTHKLLSGIYHLFCLANIRNQNQNSCQLYIGLVLCSIGFKKMALDTLMPLNIVPCYQTVKAHLDKRANNHSNTIANFFSQHCTIFVIWDNWVFTAKIKHQRPGVEPKLQHSTVRVAIALPVVPINNDIDSFIIPTCLTKELSPNILCLSNTNTTAKQNMYNIMVMQQLITNIAQLQFNKPEHNCSAAKIKSIGMSILFVDETSIEGTITILKDFVSNLPIASVRDRQLYGKILLTHFNSSSNYKDEPLFKDLITIAQSIDDGIIKHPERLFLIGAGDCVTFQRAIAHGAQYGASGLYTNINYISSLLEGKLLHYPILMTLGLWHINWHYLKTIHLIYWSFGYCALTALVHQQWIGIEGKLFSASDECFQMIYTAAWEAFLSAIQVHYSDILKVLFDNSNPDTNFLVINNIIQEYIAKGKAANDQNFIIWTDFLFNRGMLYQGSRDAVRRGQHDLIHSLVKSMAIDFFAVGKNPNGTMIMQWLTTLETVPPYWRQQMLAGLTVSMKGKEGHNVAADYYMERMIDTIESGIGGSRFVASKNTAARVACNVAYLSQIKENFKQDLNITPKGDHVTRSIDKGVAILSHHMIRRNIFTIVPNRKAGNYLSSTEIPIVYSDSIQSPISIQNTESDFSAVPQSKEKDILSDFNKFINYDINSNGVKKDPLPNDSKPEKNGKLIKTFEAFMQLLPKGEHKRTKYYLVTIKGVDMLLLSLLKNINQMKKLSNDELSQAVNFIMISNEKKKKNIFLDCCTMLDIPLDSQKLHCSHCGKAYVREKYWIDHLEACALNYKPVNL